MNRDDIVCAISEKSGEKKVTIEKVIKSFIDVVSEALMKGKSVRLIGLVNFTVINRKPRMSRNPKTGEEIHIGERKDIKAKISENIKLKLNEKS